jgi:hypothetical protein
MLGLLDARPYGQAVAKRTQVDGQGNSHQHGTYRYSAAAASGAPAHHQGDHKIAAEDV